MYPPIRFSLTALTRHAKKLALQTPIILTVTDHERKIPLRWAAPEIAGTTVPDESAYQRLLDAGVNPEKLKQFGYPVDPAFEALRETLEREPAEKKLLLKKMQGLLGLSDENLDKPIILMTGGSEGSWKFPRAVKALAQSGLSAHLFVVTGRNTELKETLESYFKDHKPSEETTIKVVDWCDKMPEATLLSTLVVGKPGGMTTAQNRVAEKPFVTYGPLPNEFGNPRYVVDNGIGFKAKTSSEVIGYTKKILRNPNLRRRMGEAAHEINKASGDAKAIAQYIADTATSSAGSLRTKDLPHDNSRWSKLTSAFTKAFGPTEVNLWGGDPSSSMWVPPSEPHHPDPPHLR